MRTGTEFDLTVSGKIRFTIGRQSEDVSKRRHCAWLACWKCVTKLHLRSETQVPASDFFLGVYMTAVGQAELLTRIAIPAGRQDGFAAVTLGVEGTCIVNAAASMNGSLRVAIGCVDAVPVVVEAESPDTVREAVRAAGLHPPDDVHASSEYRAHLAEVLAERAARQAAEKR